MSLPAVSVVIVSRGRQKALALCLTAAAQLRYPSFELVVVSDPQGLAAARALPFGGALKCVPFDAPNISMARNAGIDHAAGEIIAFLDDDAVPEPSWLSHLTGPFADGAVGAAGGFVRARNGISFQWQGRRLGLDGQAVPLPLPSDRPRIFRPARGAAIKTEGTNMAVRRQVLVELGGFDPAYHFFLDETDLNLRLAAAGLATALVPLAQVHHGFAASSRRRADRVPLDLFDIGASWAVFQRKFVPGPEWPTLWRDLRASERRRAVRAMAAGLIEPRDVRRLLARLDAGYRAGAERALAQASLQETPLQPFAPMPVASGTHRTLVARPRTRSAVAAEARAAVEAGDVVTLLTLSRTSLYHRAGFHPDGYWFQTGGQFGKSLRTDPPFRPWRFDARAAREFTRIAQVRGFLTCLSPSQ